jgi:hypothetical protein
MESTYRRLLPRTFKEYCENCSVPANHITDEIIVKYDIVSTYNSDTNWLHSQRLKQRKEMRRKGNSQGNVGRG